MAEVMLTTMDSKGRVLIPKKLRKKNFKYFLITVEGNYIYLKKANLEKIMPKRNGSVIEFYSVSRDKD